MTQDDFPSIFEETSFTLRGGCRVDFCVVSSPTYYEKAMDYPLKTTVMFQARDLILDFVTVDIYNRKTHPHRRILPAELLDFAYAVLPHNKISFCTEDPDTPRKYFVFYTRPENVVIHNFDYRNMFDDARHVYMKKHGKI